MAVVDVEDQEAMAAILEVIADAGLGDIEPMPDFLARAIVSAQRREGDKPIGAERKTIARIPNRIER